MEASIIVTYHNEGQGFIEECISQIINSVDIEHEIIVVDDCSLRPLKHIDGVKIIRNKHNEGVGFSFDIGVKNSKYENIILSACDMRFIKNNWVSKIVEEINNYPKSLLCTSCVGLNREKPENMDFEKRRLRSKCYGATILMFHDSNSNPRKEKTFRGIIEAKWNKPPIDRTQSYEIPCILGACYGVKKDWYNYIDGFWGHRRWGSLEPYISLKSWMFGGSCRCAPHIETGHIFKKNGTHGTLQSDVLYNKVMIATLLLDDHQRLIDFLGSNGTVFKAKRQYENNKSVILSKKEEYNKKKIMHEKDFCRVWDIDYRLNGTGVTVN